MPSWLCLRIYAAGGVADTLRLFYCRGLDPNHSASSPGGGSQTPAALSTTALQQQGPSVLAALATRDQAHEEGRMRMSDACRLLAELAGQQARHTALHAQSIPATQYLLVVASTKRVADFFLRAQPSNPLPLACIMGAFSFTLAAAS